MVWIARGASFVLHVGSTMVLARLLAPDDFGLVAMVTAATGLLDLVKTLGLPTATVQRRRVSHEQVSTLFWIHAATGTAVALATVAAAPAIAWFYQEPRLAAVAFAIAVTPLLDGLSLQHRALLRRRMRFTALWTAELGATTLGVAVAIAAALSGAGYWALVLQILVRTSTALVAMWIASGWRPGAPVRGSGVRPFLSFGAHLTAHGLLHRLTRYVAEALIGRFAGSAALGLYSRAYGLLLAPRQNLSSPLADVAVSGLSRLQEQRERYRRYFRRAILPPVFVGMPLVAFLFVAAEEVILTVLGTQWTGAVPIFRWLAPAAFVGTFNAATSWVFISCGRADRQVRWALLSVTLRLVALGIGVRWGVIGVAAAVSLTTVLLRYPQVVYCFRTSPLVPGDLFRVLWRPALASGAAAAALAGLTGFAFTPPEIPALALLVALALYAPLYGLAWILLPGGLGILRENASLLRHLRPGVPRDARDPLSLD